MNARSVCNKAESISDFIEDNNLDICAITETWLSNCSEKDRLVCGNLTPEDYCLVHTPRDDGRGGGGVAVLTRSSVSTIKQEKHFESFESLEVLCKFADTNLRIVVLYRPPAQSVTDFMEEFYEYMDSLANSTGRLLVVGDFNVHVDSKTDPNGEKLRKLLYSLHLEQHVNSPTYESGHTLDLLITRSKEDLVSDVIVHPPGSIRSLPHYISS